MFMFLSINVNVFEFVSKKQKQIYIYMYIYIYLNTYMDIRTCGDINIYLYVVTRPEGVYHVCIFILILQIVAHEKTTVNTSVF